LFDLYLDECLREAPDLYDLTLKFLLGYADDLLLEAPSWHDAQHWLQRLTTQLGSWDLHINKGKCEIVTTRDTKLIRDNMDEAETDHEDAEDRPGGFHRKKMSKEEKEARVNIERKERKTFCSIPIVHKAKYLGMEVSPIASETRKLVEFQVEKYVRYVGSQLVTANKTTNKIIISAYFTCLLHTFYPPLIAAGVVGKKELDDIIARNGKKFHGFGQGFSKIVYKNIFEGGPDDTCRKILVKARELKMGELKDE